MSKRIPLNRAQRSAPTPKHNLKPSKHYWRHYHHYWPYYEWDWDDYDSYDYDWYDYEYAAPKKVKTPSEVKTRDETDYVQESYRQGFKDGWQAAMDAMTYTEEVPGETSEPSSVPESDSKAE